MPTKDTVIIETADDHVKTAADNTKQVWLTPKLSRLSTTTGTTSKDTFSPGELSDTVGPS